MKKVLIFGLILSAFSFTTPKAATLGQDDYDAGYYGGYTMALAAIETAVANHPEWSVNAASCFYYLYNPEGHNWIFVESVTISDNTVQAINIAIGYVNASYLTYLIDNRYVDDYHTGLYDGYQAACAAAVLGQ